MTPLPCSSYLAIFFSAQNMAAEVCGPGWEWIVFGIFLMGMSKGGFPVGPVALQILVLFWGGSVSPARTALAFALPVLCMMDAAAITLYRRHIDWSLIRPLLPATLAGVAVGGLLFVSQTLAPLVPDRAIQAGIGIVGLGFVLHGVRRWYLRNAVPSSRPVSPGMSHLTGFTAGGVSTLTHGAGPIIQMYLLAHRLDKKVFVATGAAYFGLLNLTKMIPFTMAGRITLNHVTLAAHMTPVILIGVLSGFLLVRWIPQRYYQMLIYAVLLWTSCRLILKALHAAG